MGIKFGYIRLARFAAAMMLTAHWVACIWYLASTFVPDGEDSWVTAAGLSGAPVLDLYIAALYWSCMVRSSV